MGIDIEAGLKTRENRLRRLAKRRGLQLRKGKAPGIAIPGTGYMLVDEQNCVTAGAHPYEFALDLDDVERYLGEPLVRDGGELRPIDERDEP